MTHGQLCYKYISYSPEKLVWGEASRSSRAVCHFSGHIHYTTKNHTGLLHGYKSTFFLRVFSLLSLSAFDSKSFCYSKHRRPQASLLELFAAIFSPPLTNPLLDFIACSLATSNIQDVQQNHDNVLKVWAQGGPRHPMHRGAGWSRLRRKE